MQLNPSKWRISGTALLVTLLLCLAGITLLFNLDPQYGVRWIRDYVVYALLLTIPTVIALRLRTVGISVMWVVVTCILIVIGAMAAIGIIVAMKGRTKWVKPNRGITYLCWRFWPLCFDCPCGHRLLQVGSTKHDRRPKIDITSPSMRHPHD